MIATVSVETSHMSNHATQLFVSLNPLPCLRSPTAELANIVRQMVTKLDAQRIVMSIGCGFAETEMQSNDLCICLDKCRKSLFAASVAGLYLHLRKKNLVFFCHNMRDGCFDMIKRVHEVGGVPIVLLFQHSSPSQVNATTSALATASCDGIKAVIAGFAAGVNYVYDSNNTKNTWTEKSIKDVALMQCTEKERRQLAVTGATVVSELEEERVRHPVFGDIARRGWAKSRKGVEMAFEIKRK